MNKFQAAGLSETEARVYQALLAQTDCKPSELAEIVGETRTNCYKILDNLAHKKLVEKVEKQKPYRYRALHPARINLLIQEQQRQQEQDVRNLQTALPDLISSFVRIHEMPGVRHFQGVDELIQIYQDQIDVGQPIYFLHTIKGIDFYGYERMHEIRMMPVNAGIPRYALTPDTALAHQNWRQTDAKFLLNRTWMQADDYTAPVEWGAYGDKLYLVSFGNEATGMIIESPQIAEAFRQMFKMLQRAQTLLPDYSKMPKLAQKQATP